MPEPNDAPAPEYVDLQTNGYRGVNLIQDQLTAEDLHTFCQAQRDAHVRCVLPTIITEDLDTMCRRLRRIAVLRAQDTLAQQLIPGLHIEGPFISPVDGYRGAHPADAVREADADTMQKLLEQDPDCRVTKMLADRGVTVSAGHTDASLDQLSRAADAGLSLFTHLGNGCPMYPHRHENIVQRALHLRDRIRPCFIADGAHVALPALKNYIDLVGVDRAIIVTDAMAAAGLGPGRYQLGRWDLVLGEDMVARAPDGSHLVGAAISMQDSANNLKQKLGYSDNDIRKLTHDNPLSIINAAQPV